MKLILKVWQAKKVPYDIFEITRFNDYYIYTLSFETENSSIYDLRDEGFKYDNIKNYKFTIFINYMREVLDDDDYVIWFMAWDLDEYLSKLNIDNLLLDIKEVNIARDKIFSQAYKTYPDDDKIRGFPSYLFYYGYCLD